ncbi:hypothetical protein D3C72_363620 [compost metagenome]
MRFILQTPCGISNQHIDISRLRRLNGIEDHRRGIRAGVLRNHRNIVALTPDLQLLNGCGTEGITCRQHHGFALLLELTRQLADGSGFTHAVDADHQNNKGRFAFNIKRFINFCENFAHLIFQQTVQRLGIAQLFTAGGFGQFSDDFTRGFHADVRNQKLFFQLFKQIIVDFFAAEQTDKSGTEVFFGSDQAAFQTREETFFGRFFLLLNDLFCRCFFFQLFDWNDNHRFFCGNGSQRLGFKFFVSDFWLVLRFFFNGFHDFDGFRFRLPLFWRDLFRFYLFRQRKFFVLNHRLRRFFDHRLNNLFDRLMNHNRLWFFAFLNLFGDVDHFFSKGFGLFFAVRVLFRFDYRGGFDRGFRLRLFFNCLLLFDFLFCVLLFFAEAQPGKEATFFLFCHLRRHSSRCYIHGSYKNDEIV